MSEQTLILFVWLIPALPLAAFFALLLFTRGRNRLSHTVAIGAMGASFILAQIVFWNVIGNGEELAAHPIAMSIPWLPTGATAVWSPVHSTSSVTVGVGLLARCGIAAHTIAQRLGAARRCRSLADDAPLNSLHFTGWLNALLCASDSQPSR